jgi:hypothetical protein
MLDSETEVWRLRKLDASIFAGGLVKRYDLGR